MNGLGGNGVKIGFRNDDLLPKKELKLESAVINSKGRLEIVVNGEMLEYPHEFILRSCQCLKCFNPYCLSHTNSIMEIYKKDARLKSASISEAGVTYVSTDDHTGTFTTEFLYKRRMTKEGWEERSNAVFLHKPVPWGNPDKMKVQKATWQEVTETEAGFTKFGTDLIRDGIFIITGSPTDRYLNFEMGEKTGLYPLNNHYGFNFIVENLPTPLNHAYTSIHLDLHVDQLFLAHTPPIQVLHCMAQSAIGGENVMSDGVRAAMMFEKRYPEYYRLLTTVKIPSEDLISQSDHQNFYMAHSEPTIIVDEKGVPTAIHLNHAATSSFFPGTADEFEEHAKATKAFFDILYEVSITLKSNAGDILVFDNRRVLHGRLAYDKRFARKLEGWYLDWDVILSRLRVSKIRTLKEEQQQ